MGDYAAWAELRALSRQHLTVWEPQWARDELTPLRLPPAAAPVPARAARGPGLRLPDLPLESMRRCSAGSASATSGAASPRRRRSATGSALPTSGRGHMTDAVEAVAAVRLQHSRPAPAGGCLPAAQRRLPARAREGRVQARGHGAPVPQDQRRLAGPRSFRPAARRRARVGQQGRDARRPPGTGRRLLPPRRAGLRAAGAGCRCCSWRRFSSMRPPPLALKAIEITNDADRIEIYGARRGLRSGAATACRSRPLPAADGVTQRMSVQATHARHQPGLVRVRAAPTPPTSRSSAGSLPTATTRSAPAWCGPTSTRGASTR